MARVRRINLANAVQAPVTAQVNQSPLVQALIARGISQEPVATPTEGFTRMAQAGVGALLQRQQQAAEQERLQRNAALAGEDAALLARTIQEGGIGALGDIAGQLQTPDARNRLADILLSQAMQGPETVTVDGSLLNKRTGEVIATVPRRAEPALSPERQDQRIAEIRARAAAGSPVERAMGGLAGQFAQLRADQAQANLERTREQTAKLRREEATAAEETKQVRAKQVREARSGVRAAELQANRLKRLIGRARKVLPKVLATGLPNQLLSNVGGTDAKTLTRLLQSIQTNTALNTLAEMKANNVSLAPISNTEFEAAGNVQGALDATLPVDQIEATLQTLEQGVDNIVESAKFNRDEILTSLGARKPTAPEPLETPDEELTAEEATELEALRREFGRR